MRRGCRLAAGAKCEAAGNLLEDDAAPGFAVALAKEGQRGLDALRVVLGRIRELADGERRGRDDEKRLDRPRETIDRVRGDQAERAVHTRILSSSALETLIGAKGAA